MDVAVLLLLPLVGGYAFTRSCNVTKYLSAREEGHRLYFRAVFWGTSLFFMAFLMRLYCIAETDAYRWAEEALREFFAPWFREAEKTNALQLAITAVWAMALGSPLGHLLNLVFWRGAWQRKAIDHDDLEVLLNRAVEARRPIAVTMKSRKVYVGFLLKTFDPVHVRKWITILPLVSGYRGSDHLRLEFTTNYQDVYGRLDAALASARLRRPLQHLAPRDFEITLPVDELATVSLFDLVAYAEFSKRERSPSERNRSAKPPPRTTRP